MEEIKKEGNEKSNAAIILLAIILSLAIIGVVFWFVFKFLISGANDNLLPNMPEDRASCLQDSDCVLASKYYANEYRQSSCCPMNCEQEAVNIETKIKEATEREKLCATKDYQCPISEQCIKQSLKAVCEQSRCVAKENQVNVNINRNGNGGGIESPTGVYLEQKEHKMGENIAGTIRNSSNINLVVIKTSVERLSAEGWKEVKNDLSCGVCGAKCERTNVVIQPHRIKEFSWNQKIDEVAIIPDSCKNAEVGKYRIKLNYYMYNNMIGANQAADNVYLYSDEFSIL